MRTLLLFILLSTPALTSFAPQVPTPVSVDPELTAAVNRGHGNRADVDSYRKSIGRCSVPTPLGLPCGHMHA